MLPDSIGGQPVTRMSLSGADFLALGMGGGEALEPMLGELGASVEDLSVAFGSAGTAVVIAYQIDGVPAEQVFSGLEAAFQAGGGGSVTPIARAALTLTTSWNVVGCSTGTSAGLAPLRTLSTERASVRKASCILGP